MSLFEFNSVSLAFPDRPVLRDFTLKIEEGSKVVITGPSGSGKTTLLRLLLGFVQPDSGVVRYRGQPMSPDIAREIREHCAYVSQSVPLEGGTVEDSLRALLTLRASPGMPGPGEIHAALEPLGLARSVLRQQTKELSGGERQRVGLAAALLMKRPILILDEPTSALDQERANAVATHFLKLQETIVAVSHDTAWLESTVQIELGDQPLR